MRYVYEVNTVERVERRYLVSIDGKPSSTEADFKQYAEQQVTSGEISKFTEGNAEIEDVTSVRRYWPQEVDNSDAT